MKTHVDVAALPGLVEATRSIPFQWGKCDCCLWAADVVLALTGVDHAATFRGSYDSMRGAQRLLKSRGGLVGLLDSISSLRRAERPLRGFVAVALVPSPTLGVVLGRKTLFKDRDGELVSIPTANTVASWRTF